MSFARHLRNSLNLKHHFENMTTTPNLDELKRHVSNLKALLDDPQPGLATWQNAYISAILTIGDFINPPQPSGAGVETCCQNLSVIAPFAGIA